MKTLRSVLAVALAVTMMLTLVVSFSTSAAVQSKKILDMQDVADYWGGNISAYGTNGLQGGEPLPADGWGYIYVNLHPFVADMPYLVYNCEECDGGWDSLCPGGMLVPDGSILLDKDGEDHIVDLSAIDTDTLYYCVTYVAGMKFDKLYLTSDADGAYGEGGGEQEQPQTGAETLVIPCVALLATSTVAIVASKKRK